MFKWFRRLTPPRTVFDRDLGELTYRDNFWWCEFSFHPHAVTMSVSVPDLDGQPVSGAGPVVRELCDRFDELVPAFTLELRRLLEPWAENEPLFVQFLHEDDRELFSRFELHSVDVVPPRIESVGFSLKEGWDEAAFRIGLEGWTPVGLGVDD